MSEEIYSQLNEVEESIMEDSREEHWRNVTENGKDTSNINAQGWYVYKRDKEELIKRDFLVSVLHPKGEGIVLTCAKDKLIEGKE